MVISMETVLLFCIIISSNVLRVCVGSKDNHYISSIMEVVNHHRFSHEDGGYNNDYDYDYDNNVDYGIHSLTEPSLKLSPLNLVSVIWYGAVGDGVTDDAQAFADAWVDACSFNDSSSILYIPSGLTFLISPSKFQGPCGGQLTFQLEGNLIAPPDPSVGWNKSNSNTWLLFHNITNLKIQGGGMIDGQGQGWWNQSCKINKTNSCQDAPTAFYIYQSKNIIVENITIQNSPQIQFNLLDCDEVRVSAISVIAPGNSPNTDGIHISNTKNVVIQSSRIGTGDDCISIVSGSSNIRIKDVFCGPGHGISIGSLGKRNSEAYVSLIVVENVTLQNTSNGIRIKTWQGGLGQAFGFLFQNMVMENVSYPIIIDQFYCDSKDPCPTNATTAVEVSEVMYINITGTSATQEAVKLACSDAVPCRQILLQNINFNPVDNRTNQLISTCNSVEGISVGTLNPPSCMQLNASTNQQRNDPYYDEKDYFEGDL